MKPDHTQLKAVAHRDTAASSSSKPPDGLSVGDKEKQGRKTKQTSSRKQQAKTQPKTQPQQQGSCKTANTGKTSSASSKTVTDKGELLQHRESSDSMTSLDSTSSAKSRDGSERTRPEGDSVAGEISSEPPKVTVSTAPSEATKNSLTPALDSTTAIVKKEHAPQQSRKEKKRKTKPPASPTAESQKIVGKPLLQSAEESEPVDREEGLFEVEQLVVEEPRVLKAAAEVESTMLPGKAGQKEKKVKKADSLDDISPVSPVHLRNNKGNVPKVTAKSKLGASETTASMNDPFSKRVDRTSYVSKKPGARRARTSPDIPLQRNTSDPDVDLEKRLPVSEPSSDRDQSPGSPSSERAEDFIIRQQVESHSVTNPLVEGIEAEENVADTRTCTVEEDREGESKTTTVDLLEVKPATSSSANNPRATSPHELAASVLRQKSKKTDTGNEEHTTNITLSQTKKHSTTVHEDKSKTSAKLDEEETFYTVSSPVKSSKGHPSSARLISRPSKTNGKVPQPVMESQETTLAFSQMNQPPPGAVLAADSVMSGTYVATVHEPTQAVFAASSTPTPSTPGRYQYSKPANTLGDYMPQGVMNAGRNPVRPSPEVIHEGTVKYPRFTATGGVTAAAPPPSGKLTKVPVAAIQQDPSLQTPGYYPTSGGVPVSDQLGRVTVELPTSTNSAGYALPSQSATGSIAPHIYAAGVAASRKRPSHLELPQNITPQMIAWASLQARAEGYASLQDKLQQQQQQRSSQASLHYAYNQMRAQQQGMRYPAQPDYHSVGQTTRQNATSSPFGLLNTLTTPPMMYKTPSMEKQLPAAPQPHHHTTDLGGEYLPVSSKLTTPTAAAHSLINLAPGSASSKVDTGSVGRRETGWQDDKVCASHPCSVLWTLTLFCGVQLCSCSSVGVVNRNHNTTFSRKYVLLVKFVPHKDN